ncbi:predicted protein [Sclerotinia sclerotiorum 1980 UF-70]|uniref:Uncharacterized protein n=1 Tax=Sclerotinia sclerotiorum (strain ATCC 18683 / 1980 / Ss-1) TaxID=665079 RepID=A7E7W0_SCLS1|nr:predicted protein [Sclerotinia sclerotiorum 1980 UF-70]EDN96462.1 predicted protein [Sclerotinia sclerotiorum 1980 UF-70]
MQFKTSYTKHFAESEYQLQILTIRGPKRDTIDLSLYKTRLNHKKPLNNTPNILAR